MTTLKISMVLVLAMYTAVAHAATEAPAAADKAKEKFIIKIMGLSIGLAGTVLGIGIPLLAIWTDYKKRHQLITLCHQERIAALEKGLEVPPYPAGLIDEAPEKVEPPDPNAPPKGLEAGLMWLAIGIGLSVYLSFQPRAHPSLGAIPIGIGIVYLICYAIERRRKNARSV